jgi:hypothetical protein
MRKRSLRGLLGIAALSLLAVAAAPATASAFTVNTSPASNVGAYSATLNGSVYIPVVYGESALAGYEYGPTTAYGSYTQEVLIENAYGWVSVPQLVENLAPETTYHFRFGAMDKSGKISYGEDRTFTTSSLPRFEAASYPASLTAAQRGSNPLSISMEAGSLTCNSITGAGTLGSTASKATLTPSFSECSAFGNTAAVKTNGCTLKVQAGDSGTWSAKLDVACPEGQAIEVNAASCAVSIPAQTGRTVARTSRDTSTEPNSIDVDFDISNLTYQVTNDGFLCKFNGTGTRGDGGVDGSMDLTAKNGSGTPILLKIGY